MACIIMALYLYFVLFCLYLVIGIFTLLHVELCTLYNYMIKKRKKRKAQLVRLRGCVSIHEPGGLSSIPSQGVVGSIP